MQLVDEAGAKILLDYVNTSAKPDVIALSRVESLLEGVLDAAVEEAEGTYLHS